MDVTTTNVLTQAPSLAEVDSARPRRGTGAPERCSSHKAAILGLLRERGLVGVLSSELYDAPEKFGRSPRNRISELRREGHLIEGSPRGSSDWFYCLIRDKDGIAPTTPQPLKPSVEWAKRPRTTGLPLFDLEARK